MSRQLAASVREAVEAFRAQAAIVGTARRPSASGGATPTLADALRRNDPEMSDFLNELRRRGLVKG